jgi:Tol biopolymer transport system component
MEIKDVDTLEAETLSFALEVITYQSPSWSPDGSQAAFIASAPTGNPSGTMLPDIYITSRDGSVLKRLTDNPGWHTCLQSPFQ